jgi:hypothetical protein
VATVDFAAHIAASYVDSYVKQGRQHDVTQSAFDLSRVDVVVDSVDRLADALISSLPHVRDQVRVARGKTRSFYKESLCDLAQFCNELEKAVSDSGVRGAAREVCGSLQPGSDRFVISSAHNGRGVARCGGISLYLPMTKPAFRDYRRLEYTQPPHRWLDFLRAYVR